MRECQPRTRIGLLLNTRVQPRCSGQDGPLQGQQLISVFLLCLAGEGFHGWSFVKHPDARSPPAVITFHESLRTAGLLEHPHETAWGVSDGFKRVESHDCPRSACTAPAGSLCRTSKSKVAVRYHTARFRLVPQLAKAFSVRSPAVRRPGSAWTGSPRPVSAGAEPLGHVRLGCVRASTARQSLAAQLGSLVGAGVTRVFSEEISARATRRPGLEAAVKLAGEIRSFGVAVALVVHEHKRLGRGIGLAVLAEELKASDVGLEFATGELKGSHDSFGIVFTVLAAMSGMEREYIRDRTLEGHGSARRHGHSVGGARVADEFMLSMALHLREQEMSLRDRAKRFVITTGKKKGRHPSPATVMRMLREYDEQAAVVSAP